MAGDPGSAGVSTAVVKVGVVEYTDPICSWAWGTEPKLRLLQWRHGHRMVWRTVMGGLVGDASNHRDDWDAVRAAEPMQAYWRRSSHYTGQPYPMPMHRMARSTDPAGRAVKAAMAQGEGVAARVLRRLRESTFVFGSTPEAASSFANAAVGVPGLDIERWLADLASDASAELYRSDWEETRRPNDHVRKLTGDQVGIGSLKHSEGHDRYAFPTLVFTGPDGSHTVPGWMPYEAYVEALEAAVPGSTSGARPDPTVAEAFAEWGVLTAKELMLICGPGAVDALPADVVAHFWGGGLVYFSAAEASARSLPIVSPASGQSLADLTQSLELAYSFVRQIPAGGWGGPTPCDAWNVRALVNHMVGSAHMVSYGLTGRPIDDAFYGNHLGPDPVVSYREAIDELVGLYRADPARLEQSISMPWASITGAELALMFAADHLVHAWDTARSLGLPTDFDHGLVARIRAFGDDYADTHRGPGMFDAEVTPPADATPADCLAAFVGRRL